MHHEAMAYYKEKDWLTAAERFIDLDEAFPNSNYIDKIEFYGGKAHVEAGRQMARTGLPPARNVDAEFRLFFTENGKDLLRRFVVRPDLDIEDRLEALYYIYLPEEMVKVAEAYLNEHESVERGWLKAMIWMGIARYRLHPPDLAGAAAAFDTAMNANPPEVVEDMSQAQVDEHLATAIYWRALVAYKQEDNAKVRECYQRLLAVDENPSKAKFIGEMRQYYGDELNILE